MFSKVITSGSFGIDGFKVLVEADISKGMPGITIVGLPNTSIKESKERIKSAIQNSFLNYPITKKIVINLSPADIKKEGSHFDLPIAIAILSENLKLNSEKLKNTAFLGELSLDGKLKRIKGSTALVLSFLNDKNIKNVIIPKSNQQEVSMIPKLNILVAENLLDVTNYLEDKKELKAISKEIIQDDFKYKNDFADIRGSALVKRAAQISAAGFHNILMIGSPGSGKTMIARRMNSIMPKLNESEYIEVSKIHSFLGEIPNEIVKRQRPFRAPHHTITYTSLIGGGNKGLPGEVVLAHKGILFMDEFLNFDKKIIQGLRQPVEDRKISISRVNFKYTYPSNFLLVAATNPCPCGNFLNPQKECTCSERKIQNYLNKASAPILDRIDIFVETTPIPYEDLTNYQKDEISSETLRKGVFKAAAIQKERFKNSKTKHNGEMTVKEIEKYCNLTKKAENLTKLFFKSENLTARGYHRLLKVARTIADISESYEIQETHIAEAISYRKIFSKYWEKL